MALLPYKGCKTILDVCPRFFNKLELEMVNTPSPSTSTRSSFSSFLVRLTLPENPLGSACRDKEGAEMHSECTPSVAKSESCANSPCMDKESRKKSVIRPKKEIMGSIKLRNIKVFF